jgi:hypothetical protein
VQVFIPAEKCCIRMTRLFIVYNNKECTGSAGLANPLCLSLELQVLDALWISCTGVVHVCFIMLKYGQLRITLFVSPLLANHPNMQESWERIWAFLKKRF